MNKHTKQAVAKIVKQFTGQLLELVATGKPRGKGRAKKEPAAAKSHGKAKRGARALSKQERAKELRKSAKAGQHHRDRSLMQSLRQRALDIVIKHGADAGISMGEIAALMRVAPGDVSFPMDSMRTKGLVTMVGQRSKARWFATDQGRAINADALRELFTPGAGAAPATRASGPGWRASASGEADSLPGPAIAVATAAQPPEATNGASTESSSPPPPSVEVSDSAE